ncbi:MAG: alcohol dehydrogenase catalytic domain-containing protein [Chloroflexi bacterium]|nr:alcohol dehydrogenase catalytic domain-containing protein [Chloroflexota bacterium]
MLRALTLETPGNPPKLAYRDVPDPELGPHDALLRVLACGLCHHDLLAMTGVLRRGIPSHAILGHEICGEVVKVGPAVTRISVGQHVVPLLTNACGQCERCRAGLEHRCLNGQGIGHGAPGGFAQYVALRETALVPVPNDLPSEQACLLACPMGVALQALTDVAALKPGETVVVTGAGGGVGVHAVQVARALGGRVIGVASENKLGALLDLGIDDVAPIGELDFSEIVLAMTREQGAEVVLDTVGSPLFPSTVRCLAQYGRLVLLGEVGEGNAQVNLAEVMFRDAIIRGSMGAQRRHVEQALALVQQGQIKPVVHGTLPLRDILTGLGWMQERMLFGRVVLLPNG